MLKKILSFPANLTIVYKLIDNDDQIVTNSKTVDLEFINDIENGKAQLDYFMVFYEKKPLYFITRFGLFDINYSKTRNELYKQFELE